MCVIAHHNRQKKFEGVTKSPVVDYNDEKQRIRYLCIGWPPSGENSGNTAANTHLVLAIVNKAMQETGNHGDGGWKSALSASICVDHVYFCTMTLHLCPTLHTQYIRSRRRGLPAFRRLLGRPILQNIKLQDVVFAAGRGECVDALSAADRASASNTSDLDAKEKQLQKRELQSVREG